MQKMTRKNSERIWEAPGRPARLPACRFGRRESAVGAGRPFPPEPRRRVTRGSGPRESAAFCPSPAFLALARAQRALSRAVGGACAAPTPSDAELPARPWVPPSPASYSACFLGGFLLAAALSALETDACPSIAWIPFQKSCYALLQGSSEVYSMDDARELCQDNASGADIITINSKDENTFIQSNFHSNWHGPEYVSLGMFFDTDDDIFKWYDDSEVNFTNWIEEESNNELLNTCATMHTASGGWKKVSCEHLPLTKILCETTAKGLYGKTYSFETLWTSIIVIISTIIVAISAAFLWFLYQRRIYSRPRCGIHNSIPQIPYDNGTFFIDEDEYSA